MEGTTMLFQRKTAVVYGGSGAVGGAVARAFAREGATVWLVGRRQEPLDVVANEINASGGRAETAIVDALDRAAVEQHLAAIADQGQSIDISFNAIDSRSVHGTPLVEMPIDDVVQPIDTYVRANFITATAAARAMAKQRSGVIMTITARPDLRSVAHVGGFGVACAAVESLCRQLAIELGPEGVPVVCLRSAGSPDAPGVRRAFDVHAQSEGISVEEFTTRMGRNALLRRLPLLGEVANAAVLMASDRASAMTAVNSNVTCGELLD